MAYFFFSFFLLFLRKVSSYLGLLSLREECDKKFQISFKTFSILQQIHFVFTLFFYYPKLKLANTNRDTDKIFLSVNYDEFFQLNMLSQ
jgi:hypothetical protein